MREVLKTIRGRQYKYSVARIRDEETGKMRSQWTYLGPAAEYAKTLPIQSEDVSRKLIVSALARLLERSQSTVLPTITEICEEASVSPATLQQAYKLKENIMAALTVDYRHRFDTFFPQVSSLPQPLPNIRADIICWIRNTIRHTVGQPIVTAAVLHHVTSDNNRRLIHESRRKLMRMAITEYLRTLDQLRITDIDDADRVATALLWIVESLCWTMKSPHAITEEIERSVALLVDRAIFGPLSGFDELFDAQTIHLNEKNSG